MEPKFQKGEYVVYGTSGIYMVDDISEVSFSTEKGQLFYILKPLSKKHSTVYVPLNKEAAVAKLRYPMEKQAIDDLLVDTRDKSIDWIDDRNGRANQFREILNAGNQQNLLLMINCIRARRVYLSAMNKKLSVTDENALRSAEQQIREEFSYSLQIEEEAVGDYVRAGLGVEQNMQS